MGAAGIAGSDLPSNAARLLTIPDAAAALGLCKRQVERYVAEGEINVVRFGRSIRIRPAALERFIDARETNLKSARRKSKGGAK